MTPVPIHTPIRVPGASVSPSHASGTATPHAPGSPQATPGNPNHQQHPQQDSLQDIRSDLDHYPGGLTEPDPADQQALDNAVPRNEDGTPQRHPDPFEGNWSQLQNDGGSTVPGRSNNCADCSRSFLETWYGNPQVSAPRTLDLDEHGKPNLWSPEHNANDNQIRWAGAAHTYAGPGGDPDTANNIADTLQQAGPGSAAIVQVDWPGGGGHAFNVVNHNGDIVWVDTQSGQVSNQPLHIDQATHVWHIPLDADGHPIDTSQPHTQDSENGDDASQNQNNEASQPESSENNGQPENDQNPQNDVSGDTPKQGDDTGGGTSSPKPADTTTSTASNIPDHTNPSTAEPNTTPDSKSTEPDSTNGRPDNENGRPQSVSNSPSEPDSTPNGREPSPDDSNTDPQKQPQQSPVPPSEPTHPGPAETPDNPDQRSHPDETPRPDEQGRAPDTESTPTATTDSPARPDTPSQHQQPPTRTTPDNADTSTPDQGTTPTPAATDAPSAPHERVDGQHPTPPLRPDQTRPDSRTPITPASAAPRRPADPAGGPQTHHDSNGPEHHPLNDPRRQDHPRLTEPETVHSTHYGMSPMPDQQNLRQTNNVRQLDLDPVHQQLNSWLDPIPNEDGNGTRVPLVDALRQCSPPNPDDPDHKPTVLRHEDLARILPGFDDMHPGERGAVVASLARLSLKFHASHATGASPEPTSGYPDHAVQAHATAGWNSAHRRDDPNESDHPDELENAIREAFGRAGFSGALRDSGEHHPDFTGRNYATVEVYDPDTKQISYVVDSSYPNPGGGESGKHSERNILDYLDTVNAGRAEGNRYEPLSMYSDREPCGHGQGYANCARLLSQRVPGIDISYGTGYRKNAETVDPSESPKGGYKKRFDKDLAKNIVALGKIWTRAMAEGGLRDNVPE